MNPHYWMFDGVRNDAILNAFNPAILMAWLANIDFSPCTSLSAVVNYVAKYAAKSETATASYRELASKILPHVSHRSPMLSFVSKMMNKIAAERDYPAQPGLSYVAVSRVKTLQGLLFDVPFDLSALRQVSRDAFTAREQDGRRRQPQHVPLPVVGGVR